MCSVGGNSEKIKTVVTCLRPLGHKFCELLAKALCLMDGTSMETEPPEVDQEKLAARHITSCFERLGLPTRASDLDEFSLDELLVTATRYGADSDTVQQLSKKSLTVLRFRVRKNFLRNRKSCINAFREGNNELSLPGMQSLLTWQAVTAKSATNGNAQPSGRGLHPSDGGSSSGGGDNFSNEGSQPDIDAASPAIQKVLDELRLLKEKLQVVEEERAIAPDDDEDRSAGGRRLALLPSVRLWLPEDPVRMELAKASLASILRQYPLPRDYSLKAGELSLFEKAKLQPTVAEEISKLGKIINRYADVARPLLALLNTLQGDEDDGLNLVSLPMVRATVQHTLQLLFHHQSKLEVERHLLHFKDEQVLQAAFKRPAKKPFFSEADKVRLKALADEQKSLRKIREDAGGKAKATIKKPARPPRRPTGNQSSAPLQRPSKDSNGNNTNYTGKNRHSKTQGGDRRTKRGDKSGDARGDKASAQQE